MALTVSLYTGAPLPFLITTAEKRWDGDWVPCQAGGSPQAYVVLYAVMMMII